MTNTGLIDGWTEVKTQLPPAKQKCIVRGNDTYGEYMIRAGVWWQPYKGQPANKGRWMCNNKRGEPVRLEESDELTHWRAKP